MPGRNLTTKPCTLFFPMPPPSPDELALIRRIVGPGTASGGGSDWTSPFDAAMIRLFPERSARWWMDMPARGGMGGSIGPVYALADGSGWVLDDGPENPDRLGFVAGLSAGIEVATPSRAERALLYSTALSTPASLRQYHLVLEWEYDEPVDITDLAATGRYDVLRERIGVLAEEGREEHHFFLASTAHCPVFEHMVFDMPWGMPLRIRVGLDDVSRICLSPLAGLLDHYAGIRDALRAQSAGESPDP